MFFFQSDDWFEIKLKEENIRLDKMNLFVETKLTNISSNNTGFWAIDNVRVCNENGKVMIMFILLRSNSINFRGEGNIFETGHC